MSEIDLRASWIDCLRTADHGDVSNNLEIGTTGLGHGGFGELAFQKHPQARVDVLIHLQI